MKSPLDIANEFFALTEPKGRKIPDLLGPIANLLTPDFKFHGPLMNADGREQYVAILGQFLGVHEGYRFRRQFVDNQDVCSVYDMTVRTPSGESLTLALVDWLTIQDGRISAQQLFYDPRKFAAAFGLGQG